MARIRLGTDQRRAQLLELGVELFARGAYDALTTDTIASEGGISKGLLFHYFGSKRGFYVATIEHVAQLLLDRVVLDRALAPYESVLDAVERFLDFVVGYPAIYRALLREGLGADGESQAIVERVRWTIVHRVLELLDPEAGPAPEEPVPLAHTAALRLYAWVGATEALSLVWIDRGLARDRIRTLIIESFAPVLAAWPRDQRERARGAAEPRSPSP